MTADRTGCSFSLRLQALYLDRGSGPAASDTTEGSGGERARPLIMTRCPDKGAVHAWHPGSRADRLAGPRVVEDPELDEQAELVGTGPLPDDPVTIDAQVGERLVVAADRLGPGRRTGPERVDVFSPYRSATAW
jgi:hypothetical protein